MASACVYACVCTLNILKFLVSNSYGSCSDLNFWNSNLGEETLQVETTLGKEWIRERERERDVLNSTTEFERLNTPYIRRGPQRSMHFSHSNGKGHGYQPIKERPTEFNWRLLYAFVAVLIGKDPYSPTQLVRVVLEMTWVLHTTWIWLESTSS